MAIQYILRPPPPHSMLNQNILCEFKADLLHGKFVPYAASVLVVRERNIYKLGGITNTLHGNFAMRPLVFFVADLAKSIEKITGASYT